MKELLPHIIWATAILLALMLILGLVGYAIHEHHETSRRAMQSGLVEKPDPGAGFHWEKP